MSSSGKGQSTVNGPEDVEKAWNYAMSGGRVNRGRVIVEEMIDFDFEITLLTVRALGANGEIETHFCEPIGHVQVKGDYVESWQPQAMSAGSPEKGAARLPRPSPTISAGAAFSAWNCSSRAIRCGSPKSARARTIPAW